jgi:hypothetical protein
MNLIFDISQINLDNMIFSDSKKNIIMIGSFTKIIYSNEYVSVNGLYINFPINIHSIDQCMNKQILKFNNYSTLNLEIIQSFSLLEKQILELYKQFYKCDKTFSLILHDHLYHGNIKLNILENTFENGQDNSSTNSYNLHKSLVLKISGIWENLTNIGITYKIIESNK